MTEIIQANSSVYQTISAAKGRLSTVLDSHAIILGLRYKPDSDVGANQRHYKMPSGTVAVTLHSKTSKLFYIKQKTY